MATISDPKSIENFTHHVHASALKLWAVSGIKASRHWKPSLSVQYAERVCGTPFKARDYMGAAKALVELADKP